MEAPSLSSSIVSGMQRRRQQWSRAPPLRYQKRKTALCDCFPEDEPLQWWYQLVTYSHHRQCWEKLVQRAPRTPCPGGHERTLPLHSPMPDIDLGMSRADLMEFVTPMRHHCSVVVVIHRSIKPKVTNEIGKATYCRRQGNISELTERRRRLGRGRRRGR